MRRVLGKKLLSIGLAASVAGLATTAPVRQIADWPRRVWVEAGAPLTFRLWGSWLPVSIRAAGKPTRSAALKANGRVIGSQWSQVHQPIHIFSAKPGIYSLDFRLFGWLPWKSTRLRVTAPISVVPGGESIGVVVHTKGLIVTGFAPFVDNGHSTDPARAAGIDRGDVLLKADGSLLNSEAALSRLIQQAGRLHQAVRLEVEGPRRVHTRSVWPEWSSKAHRYQLGLYVQAQASGVGTLTFYNPKDHTYGALGHSLTDGLTRKPALVESGRVVGANIVGIVRGQPNRPGQKIGVLAIHPRLMGTVAANTAIGIHGRLSDAPSALLNQSPIPVALPSQVHPGPAKIVTVLSGRTPKTYAIDILRTYPQWGASSKGLMFRVVDPTLLHQAGGIIQGMSGSPIIQDGRLVGAVTHVLIGQPALGYGCYALWMVEQAQNQNGNHSS